MATAKKLKLTKAHARKVLAIVDCGLTEGKGVPEPGKLCVEAAVCLALGLPHGDDPPCVGKAVREFKIRLNDSSWSSNEARAKGLRRLAIAQLGSDALDQTEFVTKLQEAVIRRIVPMALRSAAKCHPDQKHKDALEAAAVKCADEGTRAASDAARAASDAASAASYAASAASYAARAASYAASDASDAASAASYAASAASYAASAASDAASAASYAARAASYAASDASDAASAASDAARAASYAARAASYAARAARARDKSLSIAAEICVGVLVEMKSPGCKWLDLTEDA